MLAEAVLVLELMRESLTGTHCRYREYVDNIPAEEYTTRPCEDKMWERASARSTGQAEARPHITLRRVNGRVLRREIVSEDALRAFAEDYDTNTGELVRRIPLFFEAKPARVFDPNPVVAINDPSLQDQNDSATAVPERAYTAVELQGVVEGGPLRGPHVTLVDKQAPNVAPPDSAGSLLFNRADDGFEDVQAYFHIDRTQRYLQSLGYRNTRAIAPYAIETDAHAASGSDNSIFVPSSTTPGIGTLYFGEGGTDDAEDADLVVHEYAHALHEWIAPGSLSGTFASQARAISEGFADYWAFSNHYAQRVASGRDPFCFADWDARCWTDDPSQQCAYPPNTDCLRRLDSTRTMNDYETGNTAGVEHRNGQIWSSALREIFLTIGKEKTDTIVLESLFGVPSQPSFAEMARRLIDADRLLYNGAHAGAICEAMRARFILFDCVNLPRGELTHFQTVAGIPIPDANPSPILSTITIKDTRRIQRMFVRVDIEHPSRGDLLIELVASNGFMIVILQQVSFDRTPDVHQTYEVSVFNGFNANGTWRLRVRDQRLRDVGTLISWGISIQFEGEEPLSERPRDARSQMIPAVTHRHGANETFFTSDVRIANVRSVRQTATLIFTPAGENGATSFSAVKLNLEAGQAMALDDVLQSQFSTSGHGSLEVLGDVVVMSRTHTPRAAGGTAGLQMAPARDTTALSEPALHAAAWNEPGYRQNLGITEVAGSQGVVQIDNMLTIPILPFSHLQLPWGVTAKVSVIEGNARVTAYLAQVDNASGDSILVPAGRFRVSETFIAPVTDALGAGGTPWRSDLWVHSDGNADAFNIWFLNNASGTGLIFGQLFAPRDQAPRVLASRFQRPGAFGALVAETSGEAIVASRIRGDHGTAQFVPFRDPFGAVEQHLLFIENTAAYRTNIGIVVNDPAVAEVVVFNSLGHEVQRDMLFTTAGLAQLPVTAPLIGGRALVRFLTGQGRAYASMIDNASTDGTYVEGQ